MSALSKLSLSHQASRAKSFDRSFGATVATQSFIADEESGELENLLNLKVKKEIEIKPFLFCSELKQIKL